MGKGTVDLTPVSDGHGPFLSGFESSRYRAFTVDPENDVSRHLSDDFLTLFNDLRLDDLETTIQI